MAGDRERAPARQLHRQPLRRDRARRRPRLRPLRPRPRGDPDLPVRRRASERPASRRRWRRASSSGSTVGGSRFGPLSRRVSSRDGAGGLQTLRFEVVYAAPANGRIAVVRRPRVRDAGSAGARSPSPRATARGSSTRPSRARVARTSSAPTRATCSARRSTSARRSPASSRAPRAAPAPTLDATTAPAHRGGGFEALIERGDLSAGVVLLSLLVAAFWGAAHALTPGHGKALVAGYLVGTRGRPRHAVVLGATVTVTHTAGVFALGLVTLLLSRFVVPEQLYPWLTLASGLLVVAVGLGVLRQRLRGGHRPRTRSPPRAPPRHDHHHHEARPASRPHRRPRADVTRHPRRRHRGRAPPVPLGARRAAERDRPAPGRLRDGAHRRLQPRARRDDHRHRPARRPRAPGVLARPLRRARRPGAPGCLGGGDRRSSGSRSRSRPCPAWRRANRTPRRANNDDTDATEEGTRCSGSTTGLQGSHRAAPCSS